MPRGRYQQQQWEARERAILDALASLSAERDFAAITMDDLADAVGISKATLYQHFASKDDLLIHLMHYHTHEFRAWLARSVGELPLVRLRSIMLYLMEVHITPLQGMIHVGREEMMPIFETNPELIEEHARVLDDLSLIIREGQAAGTIAPDLEPGVIISAMWALSKVSLSQYGPHNDTGNTQDHTMQMIMLFERGITPQKSHSTG